MSDQAPKTPPPPPEPPLPTDCCGSGCPRCVLDVYEEQLAEWKRRWQPEPGDQEPR